jgi:hypothetical protein
MSTADPGSFRERLALLETENRELRRRVESLETVEAERRGRALSEQEGREKLGRIAREVHEIQLALARVEGGGQVAKAGGAWVAGVVAAIASSLLTAGALWLLQ